MRTLVVGLLLVSSAVFAQVGIQVEVRLPTITFAAPPPLVVVQPGVQVVEDQDEEVFFVDNWYWVRSGPRWYRTRNHGGGWVVVEHQHVPPTLVRFRPGQYRRWKHGRKATVVVNPPGPGKVKVKVKVKKGKHGKKHH